MTVRINLPLTALENQEVAQALSALVLALGQDGAAAPATITHTPSLAPESVLKGPQPVDLSAYALQSAPQVAEVPPVDEASPPPAKPQRAKRPRAAPKPVIHEGTPTERYEAFKANLKTQPRAFLDLLETNKTVTIQEAMDALEISAPKKIGGITGSISRWAPLRGIRVPFMPTMVGDEKAWVWIGVEGEVPVISQGTPSRAPTPAPEVTPVDPTETEAFKALLSDLPAQSRQFMELLAERGQLTMKEVLSHFGLAKAKSVGGIIEPITRISKEKGLEAAFIADLDEKGDRIWLPLNASPVTEAAESEDELDNVEPITRPESGKPHLPGVRVRRVS